MYPFSIPIKPLITLTIHLTHLHLIPIIPHIHEAPCMHGISIPIFHAPPCMYPFSIPIKPPQTPPPSHPWIEKREGEILKREKWHLSSHAEHFVFSFKHYRQPFDWVGIDSSLPVLACSPLLKKEKKRIGLASSSHCRWQKLLVRLIPMPSSTQFPKWRLSKPLMVFFIYYYFFLVWESLYGSKINGRLFGGPSLEYIYAHFPFWSHMFSQIVFLK